MDSRKSLIILALLLGGCATANGDQTPITLQSLLGEMTDLARLTQLPDPPYTTAQYSSYDRRSTDPAIPTDENWFANEDRGHFIRTEHNGGREEFVLMDAEGPGAIVRFWSANPEEAGTIRIYLDETPEPVVALPLTELLGGGHPWAPEPIGGVRARGWNSYLPIPYAKHCKVTADKQAFFYIINHRIYEPGTVVETFSPDVAGEALASIQKVAKALATPAEIPTEPKGERAEKGYDVVLEPGGSASIDAPPGPGVLTRFEAKVDAVDLESVLRGCLLEIFADGHAGPFVRAPLGDFFATVPGPNPYASLPMGVEAGGTMYSRWPMPYRERLAFKVTNHTGETVKINGKLTAGRRPRDEDTLYFHAKWRSEHDIPMLPRRDWNFVTVQGRGRYVGTMLHITNPLKNWWGEGDEKIYVDGDTFPTWFGTGSEDYFGYAWCSNILFTHAYHNQVHCDGPWTFGQNCVSRFHVMDDIPFQESIRFDMEAWRGDDAITPRAATTYWYAAPGSTDNVPAPDPGDLIIPTLPPVPNMPQVEGAIEGEHMKLVGRTGGQVLRQFNDVWPLSAGAQRWWIHGAMGDRIDLEFNVENAGEYEVRAAFTRAPDFGIVQLQINGEKAGDPIDFYLPTLRFGPEQTLGVFDLAKGANTLTAILTGQNPDAVPARMFGLDYVLVERSD